MPPGVSGARVDLNGRTPLKPNTTPARIEAAVSGRLTRTRSAMGMPTAVLVALIPAVIAFITGYTTAFVGLSFPVLLPLLPTDGSSVYYVMLALASGICAHMLSPMHACYVMTLEYYQAGMGKTYRLLLTPAFITFLTGVAVFLAATWLTG